MKFLYFVHLCKINLYDIYKYVTKHGATLKD
jgi:hypothetical protein